jgi:hypothetical protein
MNLSDSTEPGRMRLRVGEWVEVRSKEEILATLDEHGRLNNLPFMPEMLQYCGHRFRVFKRADKTCDNIQAWSIRRMKDSVHLENVRCDGAAHGGCQAGCLIFWNEAWLKRFEKNLVSPNRLDRRTTASTIGGLCTVERVLSASQVRMPAQEPTYSCQATEVLNFTCFMRWWDPRQYIRDMRSGNLDTGFADDSRSGRTLELALAALLAFRVIIIGVYNRMHGRHGISYPSIGTGTLDKTPIEVLDLQPGELVQVRSKEEILSTLDRQNRNRGLLFDAEMLRYCGGIYRVLRQVHRIIDEKTGKMLKMKFPCIILEGVSCRSDFHRLCPRAIHHYWREGWLQRATDISVENRAEQMLETCEKC